MHKCLVCNYEWLLNPSNALSGKGCPVCNGNMVIPYINDLWVTNPETASLLVDPCDGHTVRSKSDKRLLFKCPICNFIKEYSLHNISQSGSSCDKCGIHKSLANKIMFAVLSHLNVRFKSEKTFDWSQGKIYDFYIKTNNCLVECHGNQHFHEKGFGSLGGRTLDEEQKNDIVKEMLSYENGIKHYVVVDCRKSNFDFIKNSILKSKLARLFDLSGIDWYKIYIGTLTSEVHIVAEMWNAGNSIKAIQNELDIGITTAYNYLNKAEKAGLLFVPVKHDKSKQIICLTTKKIFKKLTDACEYYNISSIGNLTSACKGTYKSAGKHPETDEPLRWMYYTDYLSQQAENQNNQLIIG